MEPVPSSSRFAMHTRTPLVFSALLLLAPLACHPPEAQHVDALVTEWADEHDFSGVVLVATGDSTRFAQAFGCADQARTLPATVDTRYQLGSIGKWVASLLVLRLVDQEMLDLHAPIATYLPDYRADVASRVTLHHLLSHTSGVPNDLIAALQRDMTILVQEMSTTDAVQRFASGDLAFEPGERFDYSHSNWILVQAIVESATGKPFAAVVDRELVGPIGLTDTGIAIGDFDRFGVAQSYESDADPDAERELESAPAFLGAAGSSYSSAPDLLVLVDAVMSGDVLSDASRAALNTVYVEDEGYAYGGRVREMEIGDADELALWHTGSNGPSKSRLTYTEVSGFTVVTLSNTGADHDDTAALHERVIASLAHRE